MLDNYELKIDRMIDRYALNILNNPNIIGVGRGRKITNGYMRRIPTLTFLVGKKLGYDFLNKRDLIPKSISGITTDVIEVGEDRKIKANNIIRENPLASKNTILADDKKAYGGGAVYIYIPRYLPLAVDKATLTCAVVDSKKRESIYFLVNRHFLDEDNEFKLGAPIYYTRTLRTQGNLMNIKDTALLLGLGAKVSKYKKKEDGSTIQSVDAALGYVGVNNEKTREIIGAGLLNGKGIGKTQQAKIGDNIYLIGAKTGYITGKVQTLNCTIKLYYNNSEDLHYECTNQIHVVPNIPTQKGDSGALGVIEKTDKAFGMLTGGSSNASYYSSIDNVFKDLEIEFLT